MPTRWKEKRGARRDADEMEGEKRSTERERCRRDGRRESQRGRDAAEMKREERSTERERCQRDGRRGEERAKRRQKGVGKRDERRGETLWRKR